MLAVGRSARHRTFKRCGSWPGLHYEPTIEEVLTMSARRPLIQSTPRLKKLLILPLVAVFACSDVADPVAPKNNISPSGSAQADIYPGTTNTEFFGVKLQSEAMSLSVKFDYGGIVTPAFTIGTKPDVLSSQVISVPSVKQAPGYWTAHAGGLEANKLYYYRLDNLKSTYWGSAKTLQRNIKFDLDSIYVEFDGDPGANCGEWYMTVKVTHEIVAGNQYGPGIWDNRTQSIGAQPSGFCSGSTYRFSNADGYRLFEQIGPKMGLHFEIREYDNCWPYNPPTCEERNSSMDQWFDVRSSSGARKIDQSLQTVHRPRARFFGKITVQYVPW